MTEGKWVKQSGFTLIELLIVVAIIAILAAIAVPNFLEAQTRAKVSRVKADLRTWSVAIEAYIVDYNAPPMFSTIFQTAGSWASVLYPLSTPVAYLAHLPLEDPFGKGATSAAAMLKKNPKAVYVYEYDYFEFYPPPTNSLNRAQSTHGYYFRSNGPDRDRESQLRGLLSLQKSYTELENAGVAIFYDPTNGTVSAGDIIRTRVITDKRPAGILLTGQGMP